MEQPTQKQARILEFIQQTQARNGLIPTFREIAAHFRFRSPSAVQAHVRALVAKGLLRTKPGRARALQVVSGGAARPPIVSIPIYGVIPAGLPRDAVQQSEGCLLIDVKTIGIRPTARTFAVKVRGDSMIGKAILDGDIAVIEHGVQPRPGDTVAALIDGQVTLKTFLLERGKPFLRAENPRYKDLIPQDELQVQGVMVALVRQRKA